MPQAAPRSCPLCRSTQWKPIAAFAANHLVRCKACGMVHTAIEPTPAELNAYYTNYPAVTELTAITRKRYLELLDRFEPFRRTNKLIDVGCGSGLFLQVAAERGWEVHGTEYGERTIAACKARGIAIREGALEPNDYVAGSFDVACSFEVMEHLVQPSEEVERMALLLRKGGLLYATTPNFDCIARRIKPNDWNVVSYPEHISYFAPHTFIRMFKKKGFKKVWLLTTGFSVQRWLMGRHGQRTKVEGKAKQEHFREVLEHRWYAQLAKRLVNGVLDLTNLGDSMKGGFVKC